jgi:hypothetical protein
MSNNNDNFKSTLTALYGRDVSASESLESLNNLSGFLSTLIEINNESKVVKNDHNDK